MLFNLSPLNPAGLRVRTLCALALLLLAFVAAGCGGGSDDKAGTTGTSKKDKADGKEKTGTQPPEGSVLKDFAVQVSSRTQAQVTATLTKPSELTMQVRRFAEGDKLAKVGRVSFGKKPAGQLKVAWNLKVDGKQLTPGRYQATLKGRSAGKSRSVTVTVPGG